MSDADDGFDREAEKERLREKYEKEKADREATQQMSELLLQGATMTNRHCDNCGNPIFRHQGREFCPVCGAEYVEGESEEGDQGEAAGAADPGAAGQQVADQQPPGGTDRRGSGDANQPPPETADAGRVEDGQRPASDRVGATGGRPGADVPGRPTAAASQTGGAATGDLGAARASLVRTVTDLTRRAEESRDVGRTRELLAAAREGAEALAALERAGAQ